MRTRSNRNAIPHLVARALRRPGLVVPYLRRRLRNRRLRAGASGHPEFYRRVMASDVVRKNPRGAVGTPSRERWLALGRLQFDYLLDSGLERSHRVLEIGCGNLRAGWRLIEYLDVGGYTGVDVSPEILLSAQDVLVEYGLQDKLPRLWLVDGTKLPFLPAGHFDVVHAHSVFTHTPLEVVTSYLHEVHRLVKPGGFFDFTYHHSDEDMWDFLGEDFYYPTAALLSLAERVGFDARPMTDWTYKQPKIRVRRPPRDSSPRHGTEGT